MAWNEGRSFKHEADIRDILTAVKLGDDPDVSAHFDPSYVDGWAYKLGPHVLQLWRNLQQLVNSSGGTSD